MAHHGARARTTWSASTPSHPRARRPSVGGLGAPGQLHRPAGRLQELPRALARGQDRRGLPQPCAPRTSTEARAFNRSRQDPCRTGRGRGPRGLPAPRDRSGHVHQLRQRARRRRKKPPPFGIAQVGKSFRNDITPQNFVFRTSSSSSRWRWSTSSRPTRRRSGSSNWLEERMNWYLSLGIPADKLHLRHHEQSELSHYSRGTGRRGAPPSPGGWDELGGHRQPG